MAPHRRASYLITVSTHGYCLTLDHDFTDGSSTIAGAAMVAETATAKAAITPMAIRRPSGCLRAWMVSPSVNAETPVTIASSRASPPCHFPAAARTSASSSVLSSSACWAAA
jgi:hypothetical protein